MKEEQKNTCFFHLKSGLFDWAFMCLYVFSSLLVWMISTHHNWNTNLPQQASSSSSKHADNNNREGAASNTIEALLVLPTSSSSSAPPPLAGAPVTSAAANTAAAAAAAVGGVDKSVLTVSQLIPSPTAGGGHRVQLWRGGDGALLWDESTLSSAGFLSSSSSAMALGSSFSSSAAAATDTAVTSVAMAAVKAVAMCPSKKQHRRPHPVVCVLAGGSVNVYAANTGVVEWQLSE
jgi:hypothetical protein